jgi:hypothetical protein
MRRCPAAGPCVERSAFAGFRFPPEVITVLAQAAMAVAAQATNTTHAPDIIAVVTARRAAEAATAPETSWESEGGHLSRSGI